MTRGLQAVALVTLVPFALMTAWARAIPTGSWELELSGALALGTAPWAGALRAFDAVGSVYVWTILIAVIALALLLRQQRAAAALVALTLLGDAIALAVKMIVGRSRPEDAIVYHLLGESYAFPSGHVVRITALAAALAWLLAPAAYRLPAALVGGITAGLLMAYARVALGAHWPTDVLGGLLLGIGWFALVCWLVTRQAPDAATDSSG